ncbi:MAG: C4-dicarboxylate-binding protein DctP [Solirubrobacteraceae bacterium]|jgi:TRAP-type C4-dicarboxylate transport system substrate-binding protein|nr:C4-dicarboxylate-binding protein DctP [Solirubrobacteraceae bacterium]
MTRKIAGIVLAAAALAVTGCGGSDKAGGGSDEITLRIGTDDTPDRPMGRVIQEFARQAKALSGGSVKVEAVYRAAGEDPDDWDQQVSRMITGGKLDGGVLPARAWDTEGVSTLRALNAPFLVTSEAAVARIVTSPLAAELMSGLDEAGVVGLALMPDGLRHPFGIDKPFRAPEDFRGSGIRSPRSDTVYGLLRALGAEPDDYVGTDHQAEIDAGRLAGAETSFALSSSLPLKFATGNVTFFPKVNTLVVNTDAWEDLSDEQRNVLRRAAERTRTWAIDDEVPDAEATRSFCERGGRIVMAKPQQVQALKRAAQPVYAELERDPVTAELVDKLRSAASTVAIADAEAVQPCRAGSSASGPPAGGEDAIPEGVYRTELSKDELVDAGLERALAVEYNGVHTIKLEDGKVEDLIRADEVAPPCPGEYESSATMLRVRWQPPNCSGGLDAQWTLKGDELTFTDIEGLSAEETRIVRAVFGTKPFIKID